MIKKSRLLQFSISLGISLIAVGISGKKGFTLPSPEDIPEEILRTEIITEGRSPLDGKLMTAKEYAELETRLAASPYPPQIDPRIQQLIFLLRIRQLLQNILPF